jgi:hypothetical protein
MRVCKPEPAYEYGPLNPFKSLGLTLGLTQIPIIDSYRLE